MFKLNSSSLFTPLAGGGLVHRDTLLVVFYLDGHWSAKRALFVVSGSSDNRLSSLITGG